MEDGSNGLPSDIPNTQIVNNGEVMAKLSEPVTSDVNESRPGSPAKVNGNSNIDDNTIEEECDSSDYDALVIDESVKSCKTKKNDSRTRCGGFKGFKKSSSSDSFMHSNPYFSESIFDLLEKSQETKQEHLINQTFSDKKTNYKNNLKGSDKKLKSNPKLREYAQYLGLQPTVQFKCSKCLRAGFQSLQSLNEHLIQCDDSTPVNNLSNNSASSAPSTNIRVTRKVFLCSACGTYYENWNLFLHMREVHKRYICLYCLGMFSHPDKLSLHIVSKHNCVPSHINSIEEFYNIHKEPCFLMCCECQKGFTERDNFFNHSCVETNSTSKLINKQGKMTKQKNIEHVTADSVESVNKSVIEKNEQSEEMVKCSNSPAKNDENYVSESNDNTKLETEEDVSSNDPNIVDQTNKVTSENNLLTSIMTDVLRDNQKSDSSLICDNKETDDINELSNISEDSVRKRTESNSEEEEEEVTHQDDSLSQEQANSDDLNDSLDLSAEETETAHESNTMQDKAQSDVELETRKVPKVTLKLPKRFDYTKNEIEEGLPYESDDSENLTMEVDHIENESENIPVETSEMLRTTTENTLQIAGQDVPIMELELEQPLDKFDIRILLQKCLRTTISTCIYCNHARRISVNGKQLGLHAIAEHRFSAVVNSITAEELIPESFVARIKDGLSELETVYFNLETNLPDEAITFSHIFECFQCRYSTTIHKELYLHNRKMHAKSILLCIMCKSNFYSYSELICHLCPGVYELEKDVQFRCCMCVSDDLPSAFRLMVHLRKRHHACDVCLELCHNQSKLSNHVWKHKLHHLCYRCGIAYRNKPDITKHLYWKHGTESVTCKKCLQKKWPHVYHFCIPPASFTCEECNLSFSKAVSLMVHKRFHIDEKPHACNEEGCEEKFVSKKLLLKHEFKHREPPEEPVKPEPEKTLEIENTQAPSDDSQNLPDETTLIENEEKAEKPKPKVDVYDLPELNLSESDSSESEDEKIPKNSNENDSNDKSDGQDSEKMKDKEADTEKPPPVMETIWDDFRNYQANKDKEENKQDDYAPLLEIIMNDHDYCVASKTEEEKSEPEPVTQENSDKVQMSVDHDYCFGQKENSKDSKEKSPKKRTSSSSGSSSDSDSSSCTCGSNCSCSSSSGSSSSSSDSSESDSSSSEGRRRQQARRERRKQKLKNKNKENETVDVITTDNHPIAPLDAPVQESDLETTESDTDEDFYDKQPQKLANKLLAEKKSQLLQMAAIGPYINGSIMDGSRPPTPNLPEEAKPKKKSKSKKRKKKNRNSKYLSEIPPVDIPQIYQPMTPLTITLPKNSPATTPQLNSPNPNILMPISTVSANPIAGNTENDSNLRASKRRRVPNKFYGYSSDEEHEKIHQPPVLKWRKVDLPSPRSPMVVPPLTIKTMPPQVPPLDVLMGRGTTTSGETRIQHSRVHQQMRPPVVPKIRPPIPQGQESATDSNDSSSEDDQPTLAPPPTKEQPALYCYCRCPYDEVSEMIGCDATDCAIEWFHFECVGIMVPPKGQWFCPDCRKKKQQRREALQNQL